MRQCALIKTGTEGAKWYINRQKQLKTIKYNIANLTQYRFNTAQIQHLQRFTMKNFWNVTFCYNKRGTTQIQKYNIEPYMQQIYSWTAQLFKEMLFKWIIIWVGCSYSMYDSKGFLITDYVYHVHELLADSYLWLYHIRKRIVFLLL